MAAAIAGCGGNSSAKNAVAQVTLAPANLSVVAGQVLSITAAAVNSSNNTVATTFTFNSSNPALVTISPAGQVCGGVWDSNFVTCNGNDATGNPLTGTALVTATAQGVSSVPITVSVHPSVTSVQVTAVPAAGTCKSKGDTFQFQAQAFHNATDITSQVGSFLWTSTDQTVVGIDANGVATARGPGLAQVVANAGSVTSQSVPFKSCMPTQITLHLTTDTVGQPPTESVTLAVPNTTTVQADMIDENGTTVQGAPVSIVSNNSAVVTVAGPSTSATVTAASPGGAGLIAACVPPTCGNGINQPVYSNLFVVTVTGTSPATTVYVSSTAVPPAGSGLSAQLIPVDTSKTPPTAGTAINLPGVPTSMLFSANGTKAFIATTSGLAVLDALGNTATLLDADPVGKVLAVSPDGNRAIVSNVIFNPTGPTQRLYIFDQTNNTLATFILPGAVAAAFDPDGFRAYIAASNGNVYVFSPFQTLRTLTLAGPPATVFPSVVPLASGPLTFLANSTGLNVLSTCDNSQLASAPTTEPPQLIAALPNSNTMVTMGSTGLDIVSVNIPEATGGQCPPPLTYTDQFVPFNLGAITANQLLVSSTGQRAVVLPAGQPEVLLDSIGTGTGTVPLAAGGTEALAGSLTLDGNTLWVGVAGTNTLHRINLASGADDFQLQLNLYGNNSPPNIVAVRPK